MSTRDRILDAAATVLRERGIARTTTREIARAAGCSEALLYKYFPDKQAIFLGVMERSLPPLTFAAAPGDATLADELTTLVDRLMGFFASTFPIAVSIFGTPQLLTEHRAGVSAQGAGPHAVTSMVAARLSDAQARGRVRLGADVHSAARLLVGVAFHQAFLAAYEGETDVAGSAAIAAAAVATVLPALTA